MEYDLAIDKYPDPSLLNITSEPLYDESPNQSEDENFLKAVLHSLYLYYLPFVCILGILGNIVCVICILRQPRSSGAIYTASLVLAETFLLMGLFAQWSTSLSQWCFTECRCIAWHYFISFCFNASHYTCQCVLMGLMLNCYFTMCHPVRHKSLATSSRALSVSITFAVLGIVVSLISLSTQNYNEIMCYVFDSDPLYWFHLIVGGLIPLIFVFVLTIRLMATEL